MPYYDNECTKCNHSFESFQKMSEEPIKKCPKCGKKSKRVILQCPHTYVHTIHTVGQQADYNWKKMGTYEREDKMVADKVPESIKRKETNAVNSKIRRMSAEQKKKYIEKGEL